jgi:hypothetical protein
MLECSHDPMRPLYFLASMVLYAFALARYSCGSGAGSLLSVGHSKRYPTAFPQ